MNIHYIAGIFDGEGFVYIFRKQLRSKPNHTGYYISTGVNMCHHPTIKALYDQFGGHINNGSARKNPKHRPLFAWGMANQKAAQFLRIIRPFVTIKAAEIDVALALQDHIDQTPYLSPGKNPMAERANRGEILAYRETLYQQCKELKSYSFTPLLNKGPWPSGKPRGRPKDR